VSLQTFITGAQALQGEDEITDMHINNAPFDFQCASRSKNVIQNTWIFVSRRSVPRFWSCKQSTIAPSHCQDTSLTQRLVNTAQAVIRIIVTLVKIRANLCGVESSLPLCSLITLQIIIVNRISAVEKIVSSAKITANFWGFVII